MPQILEVHERLVPLNKLWPTRRLTQRTRSLRQAEQTVELREHANRAQPDRAVRVELGEQAVLEILDGGVAVFASFLQLADGGLEGRDDEALCVLKKCRIDSIKDKRDKYGHEAKRTFVEPLNVHSFGALSFSFPWS